MEFWPPMAVREKLGDVLAWSAHASWWVTSVPEFAGESPAQVWRRGECLRVFELVESYLEPSFA